MDVRLRPAGDAAWFIELPDRLDAEVNARAIAIARRVEHAALAPVTDVVVGYRSVMVYVEPLANGDPSLARAIEQIALAPPAPQIDSTVEIIVPVCYGGEFGPDLDDVAAFANLRADEVVERHARAEYRVYMIGFVPGFAYMGTVDPAIAAPRRTSPRLRVPAGSVAVANGQTGIYPAETPGGWNIVGRCPIKPYDPARREPFLFRPGDRVRFRAIAAGEYYALSQWGRA